MVDNTREENLFLLAESYNITFINNQNQALRLINQRFLINRDRLRNQFRAAGAGVFNTFFTEEIYRDTVDVIDNFTFQYFITAIAERTYQYLRTNNFIREANLIRINYNINWLALQNGHNTGTNTRTRIHTFNGIDDVTVNTLVDYLNVHIDNEVPRFNTSGIQMIAIKTVTLNVAIVNNENLNLFDRTNLYYVDVFNTNEDERVNRDRLTRVYFRGRSVVPLDEATNSERRRIEEQGAHLHTEYTRTLNAITANLRKVLQLMEHTEIQRHGFFFDQQDYVRLHNIYNLHRELIATAPNIIAEAFSFETFTEFINYFGLEGALHNFYQREGNTFNFVRPHQRGAANLFDDNTLYIDRYNTLIGTVSYNINKIRIDRGLGLNRPTRTTIGTRTTYVPAENEFEHPYLQQYEELENRRLLDEIGEMELGHATADQVYGAIPRRVNQDLFAFLMNEEKEDDDSLGASYIDIKKILGNKKGIINIQNTDNYCFYYSIIAHFIPAETNPSSVSSYKDYLHLFTDLKTDLSKSDLAKFEEQYNIKVTIICLKKNLEELLSRDCFTYKNQKKIYNKDLFCLYYISEFVIGENRDTDLFRCYTEEKRHVFLLRVVENDNVHIILIKDLFKFYQSRYPCTKCFSEFFPNNTGKKYKEHYYFCKTQTQLITYPDEGKNIFEFKNFDKSNILPSVIFADFETYVDDYVGENDMLKTKKVKKFIANSVGLVFVNSMDIEYDYFIEDGISLLDKFFKRIEQHATTAFDLIALDFNIEKGTDCELQACEFCFAEITKVYPLRNEYGSLQLCQTCYKKSNIKHYLLPVAFHNLRGFDGHLLLEYVVKNYEHNIIPESTEKYKSFEYQLEINTDSEYVGLMTIRFIDTFQFINSSLDKFIDTNKSKTSGEKTKQELKDTFRITFNMLSRRYSDEQIYMLLNKGIYPYEYVKNCSVFEEEELPPIEEFRSTLSSSKGKITEAQYEYAQKIWRVFKCKTFKDYHLLYLSTDILLLADCFMNYRRTVYKSSSIDCLQYFGIPGVAMDDLLFTKYKEEQKNGITDNHVEIATNSKLFHFSVNAIRGGNCFASIRKHTANNEHCPNYDPTTRRSSIMYLDANSLYASSMVYNLPTNSFRFWSRDEINAIGIDRINSFVLSLSDDAPMGYYFNISFFIPEHLHDYLSDLPPAPLKERPEKYVMSKYQMDRKKKNKNGTYINSTCDKVICSLAPKTQYSVHYILLKVYIKLGIFITDIHEILEFKQSKWCKTFIDKNIKLRKNAVSMIEDQDAKLKNNSGYGKITELDFKKLELSFVRNEEEAQKAVKKSNYKNFIEISDDLYMIIFSKMAVTVKRPIIVGSSILDISKSIMYNFYYFELKSKFDKIETPLHEQRIRHAYMDTDSGFYIVYDVDVYKFMMDNSTLFDFSKYPDNHFIFNGLDIEKIQQIKDFNKSRLACFKDESPDPVYNAIFVASKIYAYQTASGYIAQRCKGVVPKIPIGSYANVLEEDETIIITQTIIRSRKQQMTGEEVTKSAIKPYDDKRFQINAYESLPYGHVRINDYV